MFGNKNGELAVLMLEISNGNRTEWSSRGLIVVLICYLHFGFHVWLDSTGEILLKTYAALSTYA